MKGIVKKIKHGLKIGVIGLLLAGSITTVSTIGYANIKYSGFSSDQEIEEIAEEINCDLSYTKKCDGHYTVMKHNSDEPIYVCLDESLTEQEKGVVTEALDYVFGIIYKINNKYRYQIVDKETYDSKENKTRIYFLEDDCEIVNKFGDNAEMAGLANSEVDRLSLLANKSVTDNHTIKLNRDGLDLATIKRNAIHELLHLVGLGDVHTLLGIKTTDKHYGNTYMKSGGNFEKMGIISPNDLKIIISLYADEDSDMQVINQMIKDYNTYCYKTFVDVCKSKLKTTESVDLQDFQITDTLISVDLDGKETAYIYDIIIFDESYEFIISDATTGKELDRTTGNIERVNGTIILKDVELKKGLRPQEEELSYNGGYVQDLIILSANNKIGWYDLSTNDFRMYGEVVDLEKDMGV